MNIEEFLNEYRNDCKLKDYVIDYLEDQSFTKFDDLQKLIDDINANGCRSGIVTWLLYYDETEKFYDDYKKEINKMLSSTLEDNDCDMYEFFGEDFDMSDPLCLKSSNKNLLAWFGFDKTLHQLSVEISPKLQQLIQQERNM